MKTLQEQIAAESTIDTRTPMYVREKINTAPEIKDRPKCANCDRPLQPYWETHSEEKHGDGRPGRITWQVWKGKYHGYGAFCSLICCRQFANAAYKSGYRIKRKS